MPATRVSRVAVGLAVGLIMALGARSGINAQSVFINEIHYDNAGADTGEAIEIAGPAGTDLTGWRIELYNGVVSERSVYDTISLSGVIANQQNGFGTLAFLRAGIQNGSPDGLALINASNTVVQFLSYEGTFIAASGTAAGLPSTDIGVAETGSSSEPAGLSLQRIGSGTQYEDFTWTSPVDDSFGSVNTGQTFMSGGDVPPTVSSTSPTNGATDVPVDTVITVTFSEKVTVMNVMANVLSFEIACGAIEPFSLTFSLTGGPQTYTLTPTGSLPPAAMCTVTVFAVGIADQDGTTSDNLAADVVFSFTTEAPFLCDEPATPIHDIQGSGLTSSTVNAVVVIEGIVVGDFQGTIREGQTDAQLMGFFVQEEDADWDANDATSEGIFVFQGNATTTVPDVNVGDRVRVQGTVLEFSSSGITLTELTNVTNVAICDTGHAFTRTPVSLPVATLDTWERYEGMAIRIDQVLTVTETFNLGSFGEMVLAVDRLPNPTHLKSPGSAAEALQALNDRSRIILDDGSNLARQNLDPTPYPEAGGLDAEAGQTVRVGDRVNEHTPGGIPIEGVLEQRFGAYRIQPTGSIFFNPPDNSRPSAPAPIGGRVHVASFNVLNYFTTLDTGAPVCGPTGGLDCRGANNALEFTRQRDKILTALGAINAHVVGLIELENNPAASIQNLVDGLNAATQPGRYAFIDTGTIGTDAIKVGFIYQPAVLTPVGSHSILDAIVDPRAITTQNRPALAQTFRRNGVRSDLQHFTVVVNHFKSKGSACADNPPEPGELFDPDTDDGQGNCNLTRTSMAQALIDWLATNPTYDPTPAADRKLLIIGDLNAYAQEHPIQALTDSSFGLPGFPANPHATYTNMIDVFLGAESYSFVFQGQSGYLDHALANPVLQPLVSGVTEWHINADEPVALDYNLEWTASIDKNANQQTALYAPDAFRSADHDPLIVGFNPLCGDLDDDGNVDARDLLRFLAASRSGAYHRRVDYDSNGIINARDLLIWLRCQLQFKLPAH